MGKSLWLSKRTEKISTWPSLFSLLWSRLQDLPWSWHIGASLLTWALPCLGLKIWFLSISRVMVASCPQWFPYLDGSWSSNWPWALEIFFRQLSRMGGAFQESAGWSPWFVKKLVMGTVAVWIMPSSIKFTWFFSCPFYTVSSLRPGPVSNPVLNPWISKSQSQCFIGVGSKRSRDLPCVFHSLQFLLKKSRAP